MEQIRKFSEHFKGAGKTWVNEVMWYDVQGKNLFFHLAPADLAPQVERSRELLTQALSQIANDMEEQSSLRDREFVIAASKIVKDHPFIFKRLGFTIFEKESDDENIDDMSKLGIEGMRKGITRSDEAMATISRRDFLEKYRTREKETDVGASAD